MEKLEKYITWTSLKNFIFMMLGNALVAYSYQGFVRVNGFLSGGVYGVAGILNYYVPVIEFSVAVLILNAPCLLAGWIYLDRKLLVMTGVTILIQVGFLELFDSAYIYSNDRLLAAIFAGVSMGFGDGLILRSGGCSSGTYLVSAILSKKLGIALGSITTVINFSIIGMSTCIFGLERGLYTLIMVYVCGVTINAVMDAISRKRTAFIISPQGEEIGRQVITELKRGVTMLDGKGLYTGKDVNMLVCVVNRLEVVKLKELAQKIDPNAFITFYETNDLSGKFNKHNAIFDKDEI